MRILLLILLLSMPSLAAAQAYEAALTDIGSKARYSAIEFMSAGESVALPLDKDAENLPPATPQAQALRVVVYRSEAHQSLVIETLTTGLEGCCSKVAQARAFDLDAFAARFGFKGEISGFAFSGWSSPRSFRFIYKDKPFHATVIDGGRIRVERGS